MIGQVQSIAIFRDRSILLTEYKLKNIQALLEEVVLKMNKVTYREVIEADKYNIQVLSEDCFSFICVTTKNYETYIATELLEDLKDEFKAKIHPEDRLNAKELNLQEAMQPILKSKLEFYNSPACNQITQSLDNVRVAREVAQENLENLLERGQKLEILVDSSKSLNEESLMFKKNTKKIEKKMWWHNEKQKIKIGAALISFGYVGLASICGFTFKMC